MFFQKIVTFVDDFCKALFNLMDLNKDGFVSFDEFKSLIGMAGLDPNDPIVETLFQCLDTDKDNRLNYDGKIILQL